MLLLWVWVAEVCPEVAVSVEPVLVPEVLVSPVDDDDPVGGALVLLELSLVGLVLLLLLASVVLNDEDEEVITDEELDVAEVAVVSALVVGAEDDIGGRNFQGDGERISLAALLHAGQEKTVGLHITA